VQGFKKQALPQALKLYNRPPRAFPNDLDKNSNHIAIRNENEIPGEISLFSEMLTLLENSITLFETQKTYFHPK
jgi:hypothetical protein